MQGVRGSNPRTSTNELPRQSYFISSPTFIFPLLAAVVSNGFSSEEAALKWRGPEAMARVRFTNEAPIPGEWAP
jgi:hypothetical protein